MVERKVKKRTSPKRTRKTSPKRTRKTSPKRTRKTSPKRTRKTSPKRTRKTSPRRKKRTKSKRLNPGYFRRLYDNYMGRHGTNRQTGRVVEDFSGSLEDEEELERRLLLEREIKARSERYLRDFSNSDYRNDMRNARTKISQRLILGRFETGIIQQINIQKLNQITINGLDLGESTAVRSRGLRMTIDELNQRYGL